MPLVHRGGGAARNQQCNEFSLRETFTELNKTGSGGAGSNFSCFDHSVYKLQYFWHLSAKLHVSFTSLKTALKRFLADGSSFHYASSPAPQALLSCTNTPFFRAIFLLLWGLSVPLSDVPAARPVFDECHTTAQCPSPHCKVPARWTALHLHSWQ